jgi:hypothetical protein
MHSLRRRTGFYWLTYFIGVQRLTGVPKRRQVVILGQTTYFGVVHIH